MADDPVAEALKILSSRSDPVAADTAALRKQFVDAPRARDAAAPGLAETLAGLDPTNPGNLERLLPAAVQGGASMLLGPETLLGKIGTGMVTSPLADLVSGGYKALQGKDSGITVEGLLRSAGLGGLFEGVFGGGGAVTSSLSGKMGAEAAEQEVKTGVRTVADALEQSHVDKTLTSLRDEEVDRQVAQGIGVPQVRPSELTLQDLSAQRGPLRRSVKQATSRIFGGISKDIEDTLAQYKELPAQSSLADAIQAQRDWVTGEGRQLSPGMDRRLRDLQYDGGVHATNVGTYLGTRSQLLEVLRKPGSAIDKRVANKLIGTIDADITQVIPPEARARMTTLRDDWSTANSIFSNEYRSALGKAKTPGQIADVLYGAASGKDSLRAAQVVRNISTHAPEEMPMVRSAFAERAMADPAGVTAEMDPAVFKALYGGTGFDTPQGWMDAIKGQVNLQRVAHDPQLAARYQLLFKKGAQSLGGDKYERALKAAEQNLRKVKDPVAAIQNGLAEGQTPEQLSSAMGEDAFRKQMVQPWGSNFKRYVEHRTLFHIALSGSLFNASAYTGHPMAFIAPLVYLGSSKAIGAALGNKTVANYYYKALTSKTLDASAYYMGRAAAAGLTSYAKSELNDDN